MACCCGFCNCPDSRQIHVTLSGWETDPPGTQCNQADNSCLNQTYVFPITGGGMLLCEHVRVLPQFTPVLTRRYQRMLLVTVECISNALLITVRIGTNAFWQQPTDPQPANWGLLTTPNGFRGWGASVAVVCAAQEGAVSSDYFLGTSNEFATGIVLPDGSAQSPTVLQGVNWHWHCSEFLNPMGRYGGSMNVTVTAA